MRIVRLPIDYPRINQFPEWFTVDSDATFRVTDGDVQKTTGKELLSGLTLHLKAGESRALTINPVD